MNKRQLYWICQICGWTLNAFASISLLATTNTKITSNQITVQLLLAIFYILTSNIYRNYIIKKGWLRLSIPQVLPRVLVACLILGLLSFIFSFSVSYPFGMIKGDLQNNIQSVIISMTISSTALYFIWTVIYFVYYYVENYRAGLKFEAAMNEIKLNRLKSQLNPHFIFNALNSVRALVDEDPTKAKTAITQLSNILRNSLTMDEKKLINFNDELKTVKDYLALESIRFEERLQTELLIHPESDHFDVPPLMLQTLVENGIKHGISNLVEGGLIQIKTKVSDDFLNITIRNSGQYVNGLVMKHAGYGIDNTKQRLNLLFGKEASFKIRNEDDEFVVTELVIPRKI